jgi:hypothetical protein
MMEKNETEFFNEFVKGTPDLFNTEIVRDTKTNWTLYQYFRSISSDIIPLYKWQLQTYMWLLNLKKSELVHVLTDTPEVLIKKEKDRLLWDFIGTQQDYEEACAEIDKLHHYDDIPMSEKVHIQKYDRDDDMIDRLKTRIGECRSFLNNFEINIKNDKYEMDTEE